MPHGDGIGHNKNGDNDEVLGNDASSAVPDNNCGIGEDESVRIPSTCGMMINLGKLCDTGIIGEECDCFNKEFRGKASYAYCFYRNECLQTLLR
jgi:hypothetical protein